MQRFALPLWSEHCNIDPKKIKIFSKMQNYSK